MFSPGNPLLQDTCSRCERPAVIRRDDLGERFCDHHFLADIRAHVESNIVRNRMIAPGDHITVALSGGKDSSALLLMLYDLLPLWPGVELTALTIDEGIAGYREETMRAAVDLTRVLGITHEIVSFSGHFGKTLDAMVKGNEPRACTICGVMRRRALSEASRWIGGTTLATGHNRDDEAQSLLMNVLRGDLPRLLQDSAKGSSGSFIPRIKPLSVLSEREVLTYLLVRGFFRDLPECPYSHTALRSEVRRMIGEFDEQCPGTSARLIHLRDEIRRSSPKGVSPGQPGSCGICGQPCRGEICQVCRILDSFRD